jgi:cobalt-zinc-cadmium efflux system membrane fusion protein
LPGEVGLNEDRLAHIVPRVSGIARDIRKNLGDQVRKDEVMAELESRELADAKADYLASRERLALTQTNFIREERLWRENISAELEYLEAKQAFAETKIELRAAEQKLHALGFSEEFLKQLPTHSEMSLTRYNMVAPFDGTVIEKHITLGEMIKDDVTAYVVADLSSVWVNINVYQKDLLFIKKGLSVDIFHGMILPQ